MTYKYWGMTDLFLVYVFSVAWHYTAKLYTCPEILTERRGIMYVFITYMVWESLR
jgi:hypothetical protein